MLMITNCLSMDDFEIDEISRSQMWNIENADEIIVLGERGIEERGTHEKLMELKGTYSKLNSFIYN